jgi:sialate O-acetylesterase
MYQNYRQWGAVALAATAFLFSGGMAHANVKLPQILSDGMVLQRRTNTRIWGTGTPGEKVTVSLAGQKQSTETQSDGTWEVRLKPMEAGGPHTLTVQGNNTLEVKDVLIGEVWVCSGQSNMEWNMAWLSNTKDEIATAKDSQLRMFTVPRDIRFTPQTDISGGAWKPTAPENTGAFSAVGYYFAKHLRKALNVPVGMIHTAWGGTRIEAWTSKPVNLRNGLQEAEFIATDPNSPVLKALMERYNRAMARWQEIGSPSGAFIDPGISSVAKGWELPTTDDSTWRTINAPGDWESSGIPELDTVDGGVWFRKTITLPDDVTSIRSDDGISLTLGAIDDFDQTFINGVKVGQTGDEVPNFWQHQRQYRIPEGVLRPGKNVIAVRVWDGQGAGGFIGPAAAMALSTSKEIIAPLAGEWKYKIEVSRPQYPGDPPNQGNPNGASVLYNGMLHPIKNYTIKGAIWYQGESNAGQFVEYRKRLPAMIQNWRDDFQVGNFPFFIVQLAPFTTIQANPGESSWAGLREAQMMAVQALPHVGVAVITDVGDEKDIHPQRKEPVGARLALLARKMTYGEKVVAHGPRYKSMTVENGKAILTFETDGELFVAPTDSADRPVSGGKLVGFAIAGADGKFVWAEATLLGKNRVVVSSPQVPTPKTVRFGWADFPVVNLWNSLDSGKTAYLPASPFRTDAPTLEPQRQGGN